MKKILVLALFFGLVGGLVLPGRGLAQTSDTSIQALQAQIQALLAQIAQLQSQMSALQGGDMYQDPSFKAYSSEPGPTVNINPEKKFFSGDRVRSTFDLNVRETPGGKSLAVVKPYTQGTVSAGPENSGGYFWWMIKYDNGVTGFSVGDFLEKLETYLPAVNGNQAPVLEETSLVSPTSVGAGDSNWWRLRASDPEGGKVIYKVNWGDGTSNTYIMPSFKPATDNPRYASDVPAQPGTDVAATHIYANPGFYTIQMVVTDEQGVGVSRNLSVEVISKGSIATKSTKFAIGDKVQTTDYLNVRTGPSGVPVGIQPPGKKATVTGGPVWSILGKWWWSLNYEDGVDGWSAEDWLVKTDGSQYAAPSFKSPLIGDQWQLGGAYNIAWDAGSKDNNGTFYLYLSSIKEGQKVYSLISSIELRPNIYYAWNIPTNFASPGMYYTVVMGRNNNNLDPGVVTESQQFMIVDANKSVINPTSTPGTPSITVLSPNGGEMWSIGSTYAIDWDYSGSLPSGSVQVMNLLKDGKVIYQPVHLLVGQDSFSSWTIPVGTNNVWLNTGGSTYQIQALLVDTVLGQVLASDVSDGNFTITNPRTLSCGDIDGNGVINQNDLDDPASENDLNGYVFGGVPIPAGVNTDLNGDGVPSVLDITTLINYLNRGGAAPTCSAPVPLQKISINSPSENAQWFAGTTQEFRWSGTDPSQQFLLAIETGPSTYILPAGRPLTVSEGGMKWDIPSTFTSGNYKVVLFDVNGTISLSDNTVLSDWRNFSVVGAQKISASWACGDVDQDGVINSADLTKINEYVFGGLPIPDSKLVDLNADGSPDIIDVTLLTNFVNRGGAAPTCGGQGSQAPTITSLTGPTVFYRNSDKTWLVTTTDPEGSALTYSVDWGDGEKSVSAYTGASGAPVSITHRYSTGGKPIIKVTATDSSGLSATKSMRVEVGMPNLIVTDFYGRTGASIGLTQGDILIARDGSGVFSGFTTVGDGGAFLLHAYGDDPMTVGFDDGLTSGETAKFYKGTTLCTLISGSAMFSGAMGSSKEVALNCSGSASISTPSSLASIGDQLNSISQTLINLLGQLGM